MGTHLLKSIILTAIACLSSIVTYAHDFEVNGIYYTITNNETKQVAVSYRGSYYDSYLDEYSGTVNIPSSVTYNGTTYSVTSIGSSAFAYCSGLTSVTIGNSVTSIGSSAFAYCSGLTSVTIPNSVTSIGYYAFSGCSGLTSVEFNAENCTKMGDYDYTVFKGCTALSSLTIGEKVKNIPNYAFKDYSGLTSVTIPNSVTSIGKSAFDGCSGLTSVSSMNPIPPTCGSYVFDGVDTNTCKLYVPEGSKEVYSTADQWKDFMDIIDNHAGIEDVIADEDADAPIEYFNLNGVRIVNPQNGIYIKRQGKKIEKVFIN